MFQQLKGGFGSMQAILPIWGLGAKNGSKTETKKNKIELSFYTIRFVSTKNHPQVKSIQKQKKSTWFNKDNKICHTSDKKLFCEVTHTSIKEIKETSLIRPGRVLFSARENNIFLFIYTKSRSVTNIHTRIVSGQLRHKITIYGNGLSVYIHIWQILDVTNRQLFTRRY